MAWRTSFDEEARSLKDSYLALERFHELYRGFDSHEREMAGQILSDWVLSADENVRFDALALVDDFKIVNAIPALTVLLSRLSSSTAPGAPYEMKKVARIKAALMPAALENG